MAANLDPIFPKEGASIGCVINSANTAQDGTGILFDLITGGTNGTRVDGVVFNQASPSVGTYAAKVINIFITDAAGANPVKIGGLQLAALTSSTTALGRSGTYFFDRPVILLPGQKLQVCQTVRSTSLDDTACVPYAGNF